VSRSYLDGQARGRPLLARDWLDDAGATPASSRSRARREGTSARACCRAGRSSGPAARGLASLFGDRYYLEVQRLGRPDDEDLDGRAYSRSCDGDAAPVVAHQRRRILSREDSRRTRRESASMAGIGSTTAASRARTRPSNT
jgi:DNA polymerase-3 subunit alpha